MYRQVIASRAIKWASPLDTQGRLRLGGGGESSFKGHLACLQVSRYEHECFKSLR